MGRRIKIITGHYGSGKTEFSLNYALYLAGQGKNVTLADLDIVNPYFRSREKVDMLKKKGINVIASSLDSRINADLPALAPQLLSVFEDNTYECIVDMGGDPVGVKVLGCYHMHIPEASYDMWMVVNANRPETQTVEAVIDHIQRIEKASGLKVNGLINNTHLVRETSMDDVIRGNELCAEVNRNTGIPVIYACINKKDSCTFMGEIEGLIFPLEIFLRPKWM